MYNKRLILFNKRDLQYYKKEFISNHITLSENDNQVVLEENNGAIIILASYHTTIYVRYLIDFL